MVCEVAGRCSQVINNNRFASLCASEVDANEVSPVPGERKCACWIVRKDVLRHVADYILVPFRTPHQTLSLIFADSQVCSQVCILLSIQIADG